MSKEKKEIVQMIIKNQKFIYSHIKSQVQLGTPVYSSIEKLCPSFVRGNVKATYYNQKVDVWSVGCILLELIFRMTPFFSIFVVQMKEKNGKKVQVKDQITTILFKLANVMGKKTLLTKFNSQGTLHLTLPDGLPDSPPLLSKLVNWDIKEEAFYVLQDLIFSIMNPNHNERPTSESINKSFTSIRKRIEEKPPIYSPLIFKSLHNRIITGNEKITK